MFPMPLWNFGPLAQQVPRICCVQMLQKHFVPSFIGDNAEICGLLIKDTCHSLNLSVSKGNYAR